MILLTKLNNQKILLNLETVKYVEAVPDTLIFFTNGESVMVKESLDVLSDAVLSYQASVFKRSQDDRPTSIS